MNSRLKFFFVETISLLVFTGAWLFTNFAFRIIRTFTFWYQTFLKHDLCKNFKFWVSIFIRLQNTKTKTLHVNCRNIHMHENRGFSSFSLFLCIYMREEFLLKKVVFLVLALKKTHFNFSFWPCLRLAYMYMYNIPAKLY